MARQPSYTERIPSETAPFAASVTTLAVDTTKEIVSCLSTTPSAAFQPTSTTATAAASATAEAAAVGPVPSGRRPSNPRHHGHLEKHPLAGMGDLLTSCFAFVDATDGNPSLPEPVRKEMKRNAIASARNTEVGFVWATAAFMCVFVCVWMVTLCSEVFSNC